MVQAKYDHKQIEKKWQKTWEKSGQAAARDFSDRPKFYALVEFPYPSGDGLHVGHVRSYSAIDAVARWKRMTGHSVLYPIGFDAFGLPTENFAIKNKIHPRVATDRNIKNFTRQLKSLGLSFDWSRAVDTTDPDYYRWTQWIFLQLYRAGMAYRAEIPINWCPKCKTGLANEEVIDGKHERCGTEVTKKTLKQWVIRITRYAERLIQDLRLVDYPERVKLQQINWIGKSEGAEIFFPLSTLPAGEKPNFVLLHGFKGNSGGIFFPWLKKTLEKFGFSVQVPDLPNPASPSEREQVEHVLTRCKFDRNTVLFGHSLGAVVAMKAAERLAHPLAGLVLAGGFTESKFKDHPRPFQKTFDWNFDWEKIKANSGSIKILSATNDSAVPIEEGRILARALEGKLYETAAEKDHFTAEKEPTIFENLLPGITAFTTRPDTLYGATYVVVAPEHPLVQQYLSLKPRGSGVWNIQQVSDYVAAAQKQTELSRTAEDKPKTGVELAGWTVVNPMTGERLPVWVADYVLPNYGTGAIMAVPAHDERDYAFAKKFGLPIRPVIKPPDVATRDNLTPEGATGHLSTDLEASCWTGEGIMFNSNRYDGLPSTEGKRRISTDLAEAGLGRATVSYKLRDWIFSRQHYWGEPIPIVYCVKCGEQPVPDKDLPVLLPKVKNYEPTDTGESPLAAIRKFVETKCPQCGGPAKRETDTMPNWAGSNWYFLRYLDPKNRKVFADRKKLDYWMPVDLYNGGMEHTTLHLLYSRFVYKFLFDQGLVPGPEPYARRTSHGIVLAEDGRKMSKSWGNVINPDEIVERYGADTLRMYEMFLAPFEQMVPWDSRGVIGVRRFLDRVWRLYIDKSKAQKSKNHPANPSEQSQKIIHRLIKKITSDLQEMKFNTAVAAFMAAFNDLERVGNLSADAAKIFLILLAPFAPHFSEELWSRMGGKGSIHDQPWPEADQSWLAEETVRIPISVNGKLRDTLEIPAGAEQNEVERLALGLPKVVAALAGNPVKRTIFVPGKMINFVV